MKKETIIRFKKLFEAQRTQIISQNQIIPEEYSITSDDRCDEIDQAAFDIEQTMRLRLRNRELLNIKSIDLALKRIANGSFGRCESCSEDIEIRRIEAKPTTTLCVNCKEEQERIEYHTAPQQHDYRRYAY